MRLPDFLGAFFGKLRAQGIRSCVLRNYDGLPAENPGRDLDMLTDATRVRDLIEVLESVPDVRVVSIKWKPSSCMIFLFGVDAGQGRQSLEIDVAWDFSWRGIRYASASDILQRAVPLPLAGDIFVPHKTDGAALILLSCVLRYRSVPAKYLPEIEAVLQQDPQGLQVRLDEALGAGAAQQAVSLALRGQVLPRGAHAKLVAAAWRHSRHNGNRVRDALRYSWSALKARAQSNITLIAFLGPDGAGKSTVIEEVVSNIAGLAVSVEVRHLKMKTWFGRARVQRRGVVTEPHALPVRGVVPSMLKVLAWAVGERIYWTLTRPPHPTILVMDRYFDDLLVDPLRYRYGGPRWLVRALTHVVPRPDACFVLNAPAEVILRRKQEVEPAVLERLLDCYVELAGRLDEGVLLDTSGSIKSTCVLATSRIVERLA